MTVRDILAILKSLARVPIEHVVDPARLRPSDVTLQIPNTAKFRAATGWQPQIPARQTLSDLLEYHRGCLQTAKA
jgi:nucleoside-diphosphate-sugar epimerase